MRLFRDKRFKKGFQHAAKGGKISKRPVTVCNTLNTLKDQSYTAEDSGQQLVGFHSYLN